VTQAIDDNRTMRPGGNSAVDFSLSNFEPHTIGPGLARPESEPPTPGPNSESQCGSRTPGPEAASWLLILTLGPHWH
jgi:hypothetical protein